MLMLKLRPVQVAIFSFAILALVGTALAASDATPPDRQRDFRSAYRSEIAIAPAAKHAEAWIPLPREDQFQRITGLEVDTPVHHEIVDQNHDGNRVLHLDASAPLPASIPVTVSFEVRRIEEVPNLERAQRNIPEPSGGKFAEFLGPDKLVPLDGRIAQVSNQLGDETASPWQQAQIIYEYVVGVMSYDKTGQGWGRGDALSACDVRRGNCTDFHSLFIALARSRGIPARFTIGFPIGKGKSGEIPGIIAGRNSMRAANGSRLTRPRRGRIRRATPTTSAISMRRGLRSRWAATSS